MVYNWKQAKAVESGYKKQLQKLNPKLNEDPGIYAFVRIDENGFKFAYVGQAKKLLTRLAGHMNSHVQHIDNSLHKRKLYSEDNPFGWDVFAVNCLESELNEKEQYYIKKYADEGWQLLNRTTGSQDGSKQQLGEPTERKGYNKGKDAGYKKASKEISSLFEKHLDAVPKKSPPTKLQQKALDKFQDFLNFHKETEK